jgi:hypothetical protein
VSHNIMVMPRSSRIEIGDVGKSVPELDCQLEWYSSNAEPYWWWCYRGDVGCGTMSLSSHVSDDVTEMTWPWRDIAVETKLVVARCRYRVMLAMTLLRQHWLWHNITAESCWRWHCGSVVGRDVADNHANMTPGLICILILGKTENNKVRRR